MYVFIGKMQLDNFLYANARVYAAMQVVWIYPKSPELSIVLCFAKRKQSLMSDSSFVIGFYYTLVFFYLFENMGKYWAEV